MLIKCKDFQLNATTNNVQYQDILFYVPRVFLGKETYYDLIK